MSPEDILKALNAIDSDIITEAKQIRKKSLSVTHKILRVAAILTLICALAVTVVAVGAGADWFVEFFNRRNENELTEEQKDLIESSTVVLSQSQTHDGYTLTLESAFSDGRQSFFRFLLTAPATTVLDADRYCDLYGLEITNEKGENFLEMEGLSMGGWGWRYIPVAGSENQISLLFEVEGNYKGTEPDLSECVWVITVHGLRAGYVKEDYLCDYETLTEGIYSFSFQLPSDCQRQIEFVREPIDVEAALGVGARYDPENGTLSFIEKPSVVTLLSFNLRALTAELTFHYAEKESVNGNFGDIYVVMKSGEKVLLIHAGGMPNFEIYRFDSPIVLNQVDHILLRDGTVLRP